MPPVCITDKPVLVTGAGGWLASHIVYQLLEQGYKVRGTVRNLASPKYDFLKTIHPKAPELLTLVEADLLSRDGWTAAVEGCELVQHIASPFTFKYKDATNELVKPAVEGVENVLTACFNHATTVKRVVMTSSVCSVVYGHSVERYKKDTDAFEKSRIEWNQECYKYRYSVTEPATEATNDSDAVSDPYKNLRTSNPVPEILGGWKMMCESDWSVPEKIQGYELSKTLAEKKAWELVEAHNEREKENSPERQIELVVMCPGYIFGPIFGVSQIASESTAHILRLLNKTYPFVPPLNSAHVDVRDCASCHILGMIKDSKLVANKRFMVTCDDGNLTFKEQAEILSTIFNPAGFCVPTTVAPKILTSLGALFSTTIGAAADKMHCVTHASNKRAHEELGMREWRTIEGALYAHSISLMKFGIVKGRKFPEKWISDFSPY